MEVLGLQVFVSLTLVLGSLILFAKSWKARDFDHADRLALFPLDDGEPQAPARKGAEVSPSSHEGKS